VREVVRERPFLGVCLGLQMLFESSEEGPARGLGVLPGKVVRFRDEAMLLPRGERLKVPHMGWNEVRQTRPHPLWQGIPDGSRLKVPHMGWNRVRQVRAHPIWQGVPDGAYFYFVHSFYAQPALEALTAGVTDYGLAFTCAVARDNIFATQFHPEKSAAAGLKLYQNFTRWNP